MGSVEWYRQFLANPSAVQIEVMESFPKQTYRNRCTITMPIGDKAKGEKQNAENTLPFREGMGVGSLTLTVPVKRADSKQLTRDVEISYQQRWQHQHWIALVSAYKRTPYFDYYADFFRPFYEQETRFLVDFNEKIHQVIHQLIRNSEFKIQNSKLILGARSAIFLPFSELGLIIVDEEHEPSYKQQDPAPRYHARSAAIMMAQWYGAKVLLGTATPSIESYHNALSGKYGLVEMTERFQGLQLPTITMIDLQRQYHRKEMYGHFADPLVDRIREELAKGKQVILFQNRRGYAPFLQCPSCGEVPKCPNCDVSMTYHKANRTLVCHCCGHSISAPSHCPKCKTEYRTQGFGTERLEEEIQGLFPEARVLRMDLDSTRKKDAYQTIIDRFAKHEVDILIGTQMVTKGLHFNDVSLVAVLQADSLLNQPDFRSYEHAFQMLEQVSGRAGRTGSQGEVMIQTFDPKNSLYQHLIAHDYQGLYSEQIAERKAFGFPPYHRMIMLTLKHRDMQRLTAASSMLQQRLQQAFGSRVSGVILPSVARTQNMYVRQIRLTIEANANIVRAKEMVREQSRWVQQQTQCKGVVILPDVDPM